MSETPRTDAQLAHIARYLKAHGVEVEDRPLPGPDAPRSWESVCRDLERDFIAAQNRANRVSGLHGEKFDMVCELLRRVKGGAPLTTKEVSAWELRIYGEGRPVPPHRSGGGTPPADTMPVHPKSGHE